MKSVVFALTLTIVLGGCAKPKNLDASLSINLPDLKKTSQSVRAGTVRTGSSFGQGSLSALSDISCFAILVSRTGATGTCENSTGIIPSGLGSIEFISAVGTTNGSIRMENLPSGQQLTISAIGFNTTDEICPAHFGTLSLTELSNMSEPYVIASTSTQLEIGEQELVMYIAFDSNLALYKCSGGAFAWEAPPNVAGATWGSAVWGTDLWNP